MRDGSVGWLHSTGGEIPKRPARMDPKPEVTIDAARMMREFGEHEDFTLVKHLADVLGVTYHSLRSLGCVWASPHKAFAFPMFDGYGNATGIRLRSTDGRKWAVKGSHQGIFTPNSSPGQRAIICEGPTDSAAAISLGMWAVGRPHCSGGVAEIKNLVRRCPIREAVIVTDNDGPGRAGSELLIRHLSIPSALLILPCKDMRKFLNLGGTLDDLNSIVDNLAWHQPVGG